MEKGFIVIFILMFVLIFYIAVDEFKQAEKLGCDTGVLEKCKCEKAGGIYFSGVWGASNCVFPPK